MAVQRSRDKHNRHPAAEQRQGHDCEVDYDDPKVSEEMEASDARMGEKFDPEGVRKARAKEAQELEEFEVKMEVDECGDARTLQVRPCGLDYAPLKST